MRDFQLVAKGKTNTYNDKPSFWMTHHRITDQKGWQEKVMSTMAEKVRDECTFPSDTAACFPKGHGTSLVLLMGDTHSLCFDGSPAGMDVEEYKKVCHL